MKQMLVTLSNDSEWYVLECDGKFVTREWNSYIEHHFFQLKQQQFTNQQLHYVVEWF